MITTNAIARTNGALAERQRTAYAITAQIARLHDLIKVAQTDMAKNAWVVAIIELQELQRTLERKSVA